MGAGAWMMIVPALLGLFAFVALAASYIHKGNGEGRHREAEASLRRVEEAPWHAPASAPSEPGAERKLPDTPLEIETARRPRSGEGTTRRRPSVDGRRRPHGVRLSWSAPRSRR
jgi:hypothetical protein